jgi:hypothetical protein
LECYGWEADLDQFDWGSLVLVPVGQSGFGGCDACVDNDYTFDLGSMLLVKSGLGQIDKLGDDRVGVKGGSVDGGFLESGGFADAFFDGCRDETADGEGR